LVEYYPCNLPGKYFITERNFPQRNVKPEKKFPYTQGNGQQRLVSGKAGKKKRDKKYYSDNLF
jgi:hypothetical protein